LVVLVAVLTAFAAVHVPSLMVAANLASLTPGRPADSLQRSLSTVLDNIVHGTRSARPRNAC